MLLAAAVWTLLLIGVFVVHGASPHGATAHPSAPAADVLGSTVSQGGHAGHEGFVESGDPAYDSKDDGGSPDTPSGQDAAEHSRSTFPVMATAA